MTAGSPMKIKLRYVIEDVDRRGNVRLYYRAPGARKVRLRGPEGSPEFLEDYRAAVAGKLKPAEPAPIAAKGTIRAVAIEYFASADFRKLDAVTQRRRRAILERLCEKEGDKPFAKMRPVHIRRRRDAMMDKPEAANGMVKALRQLYKFAIRYDHVEHNYAAEVEYLSSATDGFHAWTLEEVERYEQRHAVGTRARLALALLLYTGQRRSDVILFGRQHVRNGWLVFRQQKNRNRKPVDLELPIVGELAAIIEASPVGDLTFLVSDLRRPFASSASFGNRFKKWCVEAGLPHCSAHGLRKAMASRLAEIACSEREIMAITGHSTSKEVVRYTRAARQRVMAESAMSKLASAHAANKKSHPMLWSAKVGLFKHLTL